MKAPSGSKLVAAASVAGGLVLGLIVLGQTWSGFSTLVLQSVGHEKKCNSTEEEGPFVYTLNPRYGAEYEGATRGNYNESGGELSPCQRQRRRLLERDELRLRQHVADWLEVKQGEALPLVGKLFPDGLYYIAIGLGSPAKTYYLDIDSGSDITWISCDAPCVSCVRGPHEWYNPRGARLVDCSDPLCSAVQIGEIQGCSAEGAAGRQCDYDVHYGDGSSSQGVLVADSLAFLHPDGRLIATNVAFGCAYDQSGALMHSPSKTDGILGLGSAAVSLPSQLARKGVVSNMVGHCISREPEGGGYLFLGDMLVPAGMVWTPMLDKPDAEYYYVGLQKIRYGASWLPVQPAVFTRQHGGAIFDSGSSFSYLVPPAFQAFLAAVTASLQYSGLQADTSDPTLPHCWKGQVPFRSVADAAPWFQDVDLNFGMGPLLFVDKLLRLQPANYLLVNGHGSVCLGVLDSGVVTPGGATTIIGDISLKGYLIVYDNVHHRVGWAPKNCSLKPSSPG